MSRYRKFVTSSGQFLLLCLSLCGFFEACFAEDCDVNTPINVLENTPIGTVIANISGRSVTLKFLGVPANDDILNVSLVSPDVWSLTLTHSPDYETMQSNLDYSFDCTTRPDGTLIRNTGFTIIINNVNEGPPDFPADTFVTNVSESVKVGTTVFTFDTEKHKATDPDGGLVIYQIVDGAKGYFHIDDIVNGAIILTSALDFENGTTQFILNISATESASPEQYSTYTTLIINVLDDDDENPKFTSASYSLSLPEGDYFGNQTFLTQPKLSAKDGDSLNTPVEYVVDDSTTSLYKGLFTIDQTGSLIVNGHLDIGQYSVNVKAYQTDKPLLRYAMAVIVITVTDVNDHQPVMDKPEYNATVSEAVPPGTMILTVTAQDDDQGNNSMLQFQLDAAAAGVFVVVTDQHQGIVKLNAPLDREKQAHYSFQVWAMESQSLEHFNSTPSTVNIIVSDENDNSPVFTNLSYSFSLERTKSPGFEIGKVQADDEDDGPNGLVTYSAQSSPFSTAVDLNSTSGQIILARNLTSSDVGTHEITVIATDSAAVVSLRRSSVSQVTIQVLPVNDEPPVFTSPSPYSLNVLETTLINSVIGQVKAYDPNGDNIDFSIQSEKPSGFVDVDGTSGEIYLVSPIDLDSTHPSPSSISVVVEASDGQHNVPLKVQINFEYANEHSPVFKPHGPVSVYDNATEQQIITTVEATDDDKGPDGNLTYSLVGDAGTVFAIDPKSGVITVKCEHCLNRNIYDVLVIVEDGGKPPLLNITSFEVNVEKSVLAPPVFTQKIYTASIEEGLPPAFLLQLLATDPDTPQRQLQFSSTSKASPAEAASLLIVFENGTVFTNETLNANVLSSFSVDVSVTDGQSSDLATIKVDVIDINDHPPTLNITRGTSIFVPENATKGQFVAAVGADDVDITNKGFTYWLDGEVEGKFHINSSTGEITVAGHFDRRQRSNYTISVHVQDHGVPPLSTFEDLVIEITDSNTQPIFVDACNNLTDHYDFYTAENLSVGGLIGILHAYDPDSGSSGQLSFSFDPNQDKEMLSFFKLDSKSGNLTLAKPLNYEEETQYHLKAVVSDASVTPRFAHALVNISVLNVVEAPEWPSSFPTLYLTQSSTCRSSQVQAFSQEVTSVSSRADEAVEYKLLNNTDKFSINSTTGLIEIKEKLPEDLYIVGLSACVVNTTVCSDTELSIYVKSDVLAFCPPLLRTSVNESASVGDSVIDLSTNKQEGEIQYSITSGNEDHCFRINATNGIIYVNQSLDREITASYSLWVVATLNGESADAQITVTILDAPDTPPKFSSTPYSGQIKEDATTDSTVWIQYTSMPLVVEATDADENAELTLSINKSSDTSKGTFNINEHGDIILVKELDYDTMLESLHHSFTFDVEVTDGYFTSSVPVTIEILDVNDNWPQFDDPKDTDLTVTEGGKVPRHLMNAGATDKDSLDTGKLQFSITDLSPAGLSPFWIDRNSGQLQLQRELDREDVNEYSFTITVTDSADHVTNKTVHITVEDVNDNEPVFPNQTYNMAVMEGDTGIGTTITIMANDADIGKNAELTYSLKNSDNRFEVDTKGNQAVLKTVKPLDREAIVHNGIAEIVLEIVVEDQGTPPKTGSCAVTVTVLDANDSPPQFNTAMFRASLPENATNHTEAVLIPPLNVTDADSDNYGRTTIRFSLLPNDGTTPFFVDPSTGQLFVNFATASDHLDRETNEIYMLEIIATDDYGKGLNATATINITITDVNDSPPNFLKDRYYFNNVTADSKIGQVVGTIEAVDKDITSNSLKYSLSGSTLFDTDDFTGEILVVRRLDKEGNNTYTLTATACDGDNLCGSATVIIVIGGIINTCPVWDITTLTLNVTEGESGLIGQISAQDDDQGHAGEVTYNMNNTGNSINLHLNSSGYVMLDTQLDADLLSEQVLTFPVYAKDGGNPPCNEEAILTITVYSINDNDPEIGFQDQYGVKIIKLAVSDEKSAGSVIGEIQTRDNDTGSDGQVTLTFSPPDSDEAKLFTINSYVGNSFIMLKQEMNLTSLKAQGIVGHNDTIILTLLATDGGKPSKSTSAQLHITILPPSFVKFLQTNYTMEVTENQNKDAYVGSVSANSTTGSQLQYEIPSSLPFTVDQQGKITTTASLDRETVASYHFFVEAKDKQSSDMTLVIVNVLDVNDNSPQFAKQDLFVTVDEEITKPDLLVVHATDLDAGSNGVVTYHLKNSSSYPQFTIDSLSGVLSLSQKLDREIRPHYDLVVLAKDGGQPISLSSSVTIHITVSDVNDNPPVFSQLNYTSRVLKSDTKTAIEVLTVSATDEDDGVNQEIVYSLISTSPDISPSPFSVHPLSGKISTIPHALSHSAYNLVVVATDGGQPSLSSSVPVFIEVWENKTDIIPDLTLSPTRTQLFVGMGQGTKLDVTINTQFALSVKISGGSGMDMFTMDDSTGIQKIKLDKTLTKEEIYVLEITATSSTGTEITEELQVEVIGMKFDAQNYVAAVPENESGEQEILDLNSYAETKNISVIYCLSSFISCSSSPSSPAFKVEPKTGKLYVMCALDREASPVYMLNVSLRLNENQALHCPQTRRKRDVGQAGLDQSFATVVVRVEDINDNAPSFGNIGHELYLNVPAQANISYLITTLKAFDPDEGLNGMIRYKEEDGDTSAFALDPVSGALTVKSPEQLSHKRQLELTVSATDMNGTAAGQSATLKLIVLVVQDSFLFVLPAPLPLSVIEDNQDFIIGNLGKILGLELTLQELVACNNTDDSCPEEVDRTFIVFNATYPGTNTSLITSEIQGIVSAKQEEITSLFESFKKSKHTVGEDSLNVASIALIVVAGVMFLVSFVAIIIVCRLWRKQKNYAEKEENAAKVRQKMEEQMKDDNMKETSFSSDPDEHLELAWMSKPDRSSFHKPVLEEQEHTVFFDYEETPSGKNTIALRNSVIDEDRMKMQMLFQAMAEDDSGIAFPPHSSEGSRHESPSSGQRVVARVENGMMPTSSGSQAEGEDVNSKIVDIEKRTEDSQGLAGPEGASKKDGDEHGHEIDNDDKTKKGVMETKQIPTVAVMPMRYGAMNNKPASPASTASAGTLSSPPVASPNVEPSSDATATSQQLNADASSLQRAVPSQVRSASSDVEVTQVQDPHGPGSPDTHNDGYGIVNPAFTGEEDDLSDHIESTTYF